MAGFILFTFLWTSTTVLLSLADPTSKDAPTSQHSLSSHGEAKGGGGFTPSPSVDCSSPPQSEFLFCNSAADFMDRAVDLVSNLTLEEVIAQTSTIAPAIPRLGIKDYNWRSNCLHGWSLSGGRWPGDLKWTVFPAPINLGATFDTELVRSIGSVTATEGRALHNEMLVRNQGSSKEAAGINCFSPNVNLFRDPRWGRGQETFGEDPYLISMIGNAYTIGLQQGTDEKYLKVAACAKHYAVHSGPDNMRLEFTASVSLHDLYDTYLPAFKSQILGAKVSQIMPAYSGMNCSKQSDGAPDAANGFLLRSVLREEFSAPNISVVSDNWGVSAVFKTHHYVHSNEMAAAVCMNATTDLDLGYDYVYLEHLKSAIMDGLVDEETVRQAVTRSFYLRMQVGDFDAPEMVPYQYLDRTSLDTDHHRALNLQAAKKSIVLLKNKDEFLPMSTYDVKRIAVLGPNANNSKVLLSNYEGIPSSTMTVLQGLQRYFENSPTVIDYAPGCDVICSEKLSFPEAHAVASKADYVVMVMGLSGEVEGENHDRMQTSCEGKDVPLLGLPGCQESLVLSIADVNPFVILVLINGGPLSIPKVASHAGVGAIIEAFYPGPQGGIAVADVIFGEYNPGGRMPISTYMSDSDLPPAESYDMTTPPGRTYRYYSSDNPPLFQFGFGLSYSNFQYSNISLSTKSVKQCDNLTASVVVATAGMNGDEVVMIYLLPHLNSSESFPKEMLIGFQRVHIVKAVPQKVVFSINPYLMSLVGNDGVNYIYPGAYSVQLGTLMANFTIVGTSPVKTTDCSHSPQCLAC